MLNEKGKIIFEKPANLVRGIESVGGKLTVTDQKLLFKSHAMNIQKGSTEILFSDIQSIRKRNTLGFVPNGMSVVTKNKEEYKFVVWNRDEIIGYINQIISKVS